MTTVASLRREVADAQGASRVLPEPLLQALGAKLVPADAALSHPRDLARRREAHSARLHAGLLDDRGRGVDVLASFHHRPAHRLLDADVGVVIVSGVVRV